MAAASDPSSCCILITVQAHMVSAGKGYRMTMHVVVCSLLSGCVSRDKAAWREVSVVTIAGYVLTYMVAEALFASKTGCWVLRTRGDMKHMESGVTGLVVACRMRQACLLQQPQAHV